jgi:hypothetical protein
MIANKSFESWAKLKCLNHLDASFSESGPTINFETVMVVSLG